MASSNEQKCDACGVLLPLTPAYYDRCRDSGTGYRTTCKVCRSEERRKESRGRFKVSPKAAAAIERIEEGAASALDAFVPSQGSRVPHTAELWEALASIFGGPGGIAQHVMSSYMAAQPGSPQRAKILSQVIRLGTEVSKSGDATKPIDMMTDDELVAALHSCLDTQIESNPELLLSKIMHSNPEAFSRFIGRDRIANTPDVAQEEAFEEEKTLSYDDL